MTICTPLLIMMTGSNAPVPHHLTEQKLYSQYTWTHI